MGEELFAVPNSEDVSGQVFTFDFAEVEKREEEASRPLRESWAASLKQREKMDELFTTTELKSFGTYLLSRERSESIFNTAGDGDFLQLLAQVHHADFEGWKAKRGEAGVAISEGPSPQQDTQARLSPAEMLQEIIKMAARPGNEGRHKAVDTPRTVVLVDTPLVL